MQSDVLKKKISVRRVGRSPIPHLDDITNHLTAKLEDRLRRLLKATTGAIIMACEVRKLSRVLEDIPVPAMLGIVAVEGVDNYALININSDLVYHVVDLRMGGDPASAPPPTARSFTAIDCALCEGFTSTVIDCMMEAMRSGMGAPLPDAMSLARIEQNITQVRLAPGNADVLVIEVNLDIGEAARSGDFQIVLPLSVLDVLRAEAARAPASNEMLTSLTFWRKHMTRAAAEARIEVSGIVHTQRMTVQELEALTPGDVILMPETALKNIDIRLGRLSDRIDCTTAKLGAFEGRKMLKLTEDPPPDLRSYLESALSIRPDTAPKRID
ncbi:flagellar motor switch protein FliM [Rubricella aquisinus]|uniref:Flagellar motor switch protein FliM n=1 Tax=Rubricella aquisinus TaxID=2028108 RepID=A0A840WMB1_9RHOB|nr:FliM/FliN family flagellar motor switch protein [Rubricella aquisinus]MBB5515253.1 flagellar motor switch protein FliM [Rubricella aquisinus]